MTNFQFVFLWAGIVILFALNALILGNRFDSVDKQLKKITEAQEVKK